MNARTLALVVALTLSTAVAARGSGPAVAYSLWETPGSPGVAVEGIDHGLWRMPPEAVVDDYANDGYRLRVREGWVEVDVQVLPLESRYPFSMPEPPTEENDELSVLARHLVAGAETRYEAVSRVLSWVARNIRYELDREANQAPAAVVERRSAYCTGIARLSVALLQRLDIEAREVSGYVFGEPGSESASGYHRWIEVLFPDRGWVFSDPLYSHHFVPASYVRLDSETLELGRLGPAEERIFRDRRLPARDLYPHGPPGVLARRNEGRQVAAALRVALEPARPALLRLTAGGVSRVAESDGHAATFVGLSPGTYRLDVLPLEGGNAIRRRVEVLHRVRTDLTLRIPSFEERGSVSARRTLVQGAGARR